MKIPTQTAWEEPVSLKYLLDKASPEVNFWVQGFKFNEFFPSWSLCTSQKAVASFVVLHSWKNSTLGVELLKGNQWKVFEYIVTQPWFDTNYTIVKCFPLHIDCGV